jgi:hypothetical protein
MASAEAEVVEAFGNYLPAANQERRRTGDEEEETTAKSKYPRPAGKGQGQGQSSASAAMEVTDTPKESGPSRPDDQWWGQSDKNSWWRQDQEVSGRDLRELVSMLTRLSLRHEDALASTRADNCFMLFFDTGGEVTMVHNLYQVATMWKGQQTKEGVMSSLRTTLMAALMSELNGRVRKTKEMKEEELALFYKHSWLKEGGSWAYQKWDTAQQEVTADLSRSPVQQAAMEQTLQRLTTLLATPEVLHRFHATRPMAKNYESPSLPFCITLSGRGQLAQEAHDLLTLLSGNAALRLVGARLRPEYNKRAPLAQALQEVAEPLFRSCPPKFGKAKGRGKAKQTKKPSPAREAPPGLDS